MLSVAWIKLCIHVSVQVSLLLLHAYSKQQLTSVRKLLLVTVGFGLLIGIPSDLLWGKYLGLWKYETNFSLTSLIVLGVGVWGVFAAHVYLLRKETWGRWVSSLLIVSVMFEVVNFYFQVWNYISPFSMTVTVGLVTAGYLIVALVLHYLLLKPIIK